MIERKIIVKDDGGKSKEMEGESEIVLIETEQVPMVLPSPPFLCLPPVCGKLWSKNKFNQRNEECRNKGKHQRRPNNNNVGIKHSQGPLLSSQRL